MIVTQKPNGKVRVCIDPQPLNQALERRHYPLLVVEDIFPELSKARVFTKADLKDGFLQIKLDEESSKLTTFRAPLWKVPIALNAIWHLPSNLSVSSNSSINALRD